MAICDSGLGGALGYSGRGSCWEVEGSCHREIRQRLGVPEACGSETLRGELRALQGVGVCANS